MQTDSATALCFLFVISHPRFAALSSATKNPHKLRTTGVYTHLQYCTILFKYYYQKHFHFLCLEKGFGSCFVFRFVTLQLAVSTLIRRRKLTHVLLPLFSLALCSPLPLQHSYGFKVSTSTVRPHCTDWRFSHTDELLRRQKQAHLLRIRSRRSAESERVSAGIWRGGQFGGQVTFVNLDGESDKLNETVHSCLRAHCIVPECQDGTICHSQIYQMQKMRSYDVVTSNYGSNLLANLSVSQLIVSVKLQPLYKFFNFTLHHIKTKQSLCMF